MRRFADPYYSPESPIIPRGPNHYHRAVTYVAGLSLVLTGCTTAPDNDSAPTSAPEPTPTSTVLEAFNPIEAECNPESALKFVGSNDAYVDSEAEACLDVYENADIALINYSLDSDTAKTFAADVEAAIEQATRDDIKPTITIIEPSQEAMDLYAKNTDDCAEITDLDDYGSFVADAVMPELRKYDKLLAVSNTQSCNDAAIGVANGTYHRYAEVFEINDSLEAIAANNGKTTIEKKETGGLTVTSSIENPVLTAVHEVLHTFGMGHSGDVTGSGTDMFSYLRSNENDATVQSDNLDLTKFFEKSDYSEYIYDDVMGSPEELPDGATLNALQMSLLEWPQQILGKETKTTLVEVTDKPVSFDAENATSLVAMIKLDTPLPFPQGKGSSYSAGDSQIYDRIAFIGNTFNDGTFYAVDAYVVGNDGNIISLGTMSVEDRAETTHYRLTVEGAVISVDASADNVKVSINK